jgi:hypothetical protein
VLLKSRHRPLDAFVAGRRVERSKRTRRPASFSRSSAAQPIEAPQKLLEAADASQGQAKPASASEEAVKVRTNHRSRIVINQTVGCR